eukprot:Opistho-2@62738
MVLSVDPVTRRPPSKWMHRTPYMCPLSDVTTWRVSSENTFTSASSEPARIMLASNAMHLRPRSPGRPWMVCRHTRPAMSHTFTTASSAPLIITRPEICMHVTGSRCPASFDSCSCLVMSHMRIEVSLDPLTICVFFVMRTQLIFRECPVSVATASSWPTVHILSVLSSEPVTMVWSSSHRHMMPPLWPLRTCLHTPVCALHSRSVPSQEPLAIRSVFASYPTHMTPPVCPSSVRTEYRPCRQARDTVASCVCLVRKCAIQSKSPVASTEPAAVSLPHPLATQSSSHSDGLRTTFFHDEHTSAAWPSENRPTIERMRTATFGGNLSRNSPTRD